MPRVRLISALSKGRGRLAGDRRGVAAVEFGIIAIPFFVVLFGILQYGLTFFASVMLDYATRQAARQLMLGNVQAAAMTADQFRTNVVCPNLAPFMSCSDVIVSVRPVAPVWTATRDTGTYAYLNATRNGLIAPPANSASATYCPGAPATIMMIDITYHMALFFPLLASDVGYHVVTSPDGLQLRATSMVVAEQYSAASGSAGC